MKILQMLDAALAEVATPNEQLTRCHEANDRAGADAALAGLRREIGRAIMVACNRRLRQFPPRDEREFIEAVKANPAPMVEHAVQPVTGFIERAFAANDEAEKALAEIFA